MTDGPSRVSLARLVLEVRRRSEGKLRPANRRHVDRVLGSLKRLAAAEKGIEGEVLRYILEAVINVHRDRELDGRSLDSLSPETIAQLDLVFDAMMDGRVTRDELRGYIRESLIRVVK
jgi:hypothetical protein